MKIGAERMKNTLRMGQHRICLRNHLIGISLLILTAQMASQAQDQALAKRLLRFDRSIEFVIDDDELLPGTLTLPEGQYRFRFHNNFVSNKLDLLVNDDKGVNLVSAELKAKKSTEDLIVSLKQGTHVVYVKQRPKWRCTVTVTEKKKV